MPRSAGARTEEEPDRSQPNLVRDPRLLRAAVAVLAKTGWDGLTMEAVAEEAGLSRVTTWRLGATREGLIGSLLLNLEEDYRRAMWPALTAAGTARDRLAAALLALFEVAEAYLPLLMAADQVFHRASVGGLNFNEPFSRIFRDGLDDGSLAPPGGDPDQAADLLFNTACWPYVHLRGRHHWDRDKLRTQLSAVVLPKLVDPELTSSRPVRARPA
ncbi:MAG TPA: helix-turn-helix domain-containing protein [Candidatus Acidoferrales bacterium]|nr:helix-turn-helix domain-containing protein [Candidatus Acidoferrales bacterium]